jgi:hypothetical protein
MQTPPASLDIVTVAIAVTSWVLGAEIAAIVGPYTVILLSALGGAAWSAGRRTQSSRLGALTHIVLSVGLALIATVPLAELIARWTDLQARWTLAPAAVLIAARPDWIWQQVRGWRGRHDPGGRHGHD